MRIVCGMDIGDIRVHIREYSSHSFTAEEALCKTFFLDFFLLLMEVVVCFFFRF